MPTQTEYLSTYLQDHRAGAEMGLNLAERLRDENVGTPYEDFLTLLAQEIAQDVQALESIMESFGVDKSRLKIAGAAISEKLGRLKPNEQLSDYSPLSRVLELEMMRSGVEGKHALWNSLVEVSDQDERLDTEQLEGLAESARKQLERLREQHRMAAYEAFAD